MRETVTSVKKKLKKDHGWENLDNKSQKWFVDELIKDILKIVYKVSIKK